MRTLAKVVAALIAVPPLLTLTGCPESSSTTSAEQRAMSAARKFRSQAPSDQAQVPAAFQGNLTIARAPSGQAVALQRQADCSLTAFISTYGLNGVTPDIQVLSTTPNYQEVLRAAAGLGAQSGAFAHGCAEATTGIGSRYGFYLGRISQNLLLFATNGYYPATGGNALFYATIDAGTKAVHSYGSDLTVANIADITAGDLNGDGLADVVVLDSDSGSVTVWLARADGTLGAPVAYPATGSRLHAAVMTDLNGDGKLDLVVAGSTFNASTSREDESIAILRGRGDGTFDPATTFPVATPASTQLSTLVAADLRGTGKPDIVGSNGLVLLNDGSGGLAPASAFAFPAPLAKSDTGVQLAAGDFNEDGKADLVVNDGAVVQVWLGRGDGSFALGRAYASNDSVGYITASDLDGDGHLDLWIGLANGGVFGGDQYTLNQGYALMGRGDGSFLGAPVQPFAYNGHNLIDLNKDGKLDGVGLDVDGRTFTTWLGDGSGGFVASGSLPVATLAFGSLSFTLNGVQSFDLADIDGDGIPDLVFLGRDFMARNSTADFLTSGVLVARGNGSGGFSAPTFLPTPAFVAAPDFDYNGKLTNVRLADVNGDGKADLVYAYASTSFATNQRTAYTAVQLGNGDGSFQAPQTFVFLTGPDNGSFPNIVSEVQQFADLNKDGKLDLVLFTQTTTIDSNLSGYRGNVQVALGRGDGSFSAPVTVAGPDILVVLSGTASPLPLVVTDVNGDGVPDLAILGSSTTYDMQVAIALGNGDGSFKAPGRTTFQAQALGNGQQIAVADFNGDGKADVLIANPYGITGVVLGNGDGTLSPLGSAGAYTPNLTIALPIGGATRVVDFNGDGKADVIVGRVQLSSATAAALPAPGFSMGADSTTGTVKAGQAAIAHISVTPGGGYSGTVTFSCAGFPAEAACAFAPPTLAVSGTTDGATTLTISTTAAAAMGSAGNAGTGSPGGVDPALPGALLLAALGLFAMGRRGTLVVAWRRLGLVSLLAAGGLALNGCGGGSGGGSGPGGPGATGTPPGSYTVTVSASDGSVSRTVAYTLVVN